MIDYISPDALAEEGKANSPDATYRALIRADVSTLKKGGQPLSVTGDGSHTAEMRTGERTVIQVHP